MKKICLFLLLSLPTIYTVAQISWEHTDGPFGSALSSIFSNDHYAFIPADDFLFRSENGTHWEKIEHQVSFQMSVYKDTLVNIFYDDSLQKSLFQVSIDNGETWVIKDLPEEETIFSGEIISCSHGIYISQYDKSLLYKSTDLGDSWFIIPYPFSNFIDLFVFEERLYGSSSSKLTRSDSHGGNWEDITPPLGSQHIYDIVAKDDHILTATENSLFHSHDGGQSWDREQIRSGNASDKLILVGNDVYLKAINYLLHSADFGFTWDTISYSDFNLELLSLGVLGDVLLSTTFNKGVFLWEESSYQFQESNLGLSKGYIYDLAMGNNTIWAACGNGIFAYDLSSATWSNKINLPLPKHQYAYISANDHGWIVAMQLYQDYYYFSEDNGHNWDTIYPNIPQIYLPDYIHLVGDRLFLFADNVIYSSADKGLTWFDLLLEYRDMNIVSFNGNLYIVGHDWLYMSSNGGIIWQALLPDIPIDVLHSDGNHLYAVATINGQSEVYTSEDAIHWTYSAPGFPDEYNPGPPSEPSSVFFFHDADNIYAFLGRQGHHVLSNGASSWSEINTTHTGNKYLIHDDFVYLGGSGMYKSAIENPFVTAVDDITSYSDYLFKVSPNPAKDNVIINFKPEINVSGLLQIFSPYGILVRSMEINNTSEPTVISIAELSEGMYYVLFKGKNTMSINSFVKLGQ